MSAPEPATPAVPPVPPRLGSGATWGTALLVLLATLYPGFMGAPWAAPITGGAVAAAVGVWRVVALVAEQVQHQRNEAWITAAVAAEDDR